MSLHDPSTALIAELADRARAGARAMARASDAAKATALRRAAASLRAAAGEILAANALDMERGRGSGLSEAMLDRLRLDDARLAAVATAVEAVAGLPDPVGQEIDRTTRPNGLVLSRVRVPIGVIGIIYESRPNVTVDAAALCVRSGNAVILRGGSEAVESNRALHAAFVRGLTEGALPAEAVQLVPTTDRAAVGAMLTAAGQIDLIIPRGGRSLVERVQNDARVPVLAHLDGVNHVFVHASATAEMAMRVVVDAKMRRTGVCGAMETLLIDRDWPHAAALIAALADSGCEVRGDAAAQALGGGIAAAQAADWDTEYLDAIASVAIVDGMDGALAHIAAHASHHTDAIVAEDAGVAERFLREVDSAIVLWNASTQFADGGEFGLGAEIGIATGRLHARGPVALEGLTTYKWLGRGTGQVRG
ncbi:glutamate-5-semialdehyde dehydrogenase [Sphingomonas sp. BE138]|uniref:glutamate-5-semialdehyde dehydrogenase n=1 Tax=Sphingomonas sp. BE138 TaxID=2817845 RepID=UPI002865AFF8|nr:glutamate-5-semialdehyde dehydrogenase [Sphingomonas sp. BE138]MDR6787846.1 glutamate-5-semialdehyde dehydrogenase [Sphingomonas sp. BE138]